MACVSNEYLSTEWHASPANAYHLNAIACFPIRHKTVMGSILLRKDPIHIIGNLSYRICQTTVRGRLPSPV
jgi:hypothetical protein